jgi:tRNA G18 (ribose-2'-O)-methylase SpoU
MTSPAASSAELYVVLSNTSGRQNLGTYLRTASAFGTTQVLVGECRARFEFDGGRLWRCSLGGD